MSAENTDPINLSEIEQVQQQQVAAQPAVVPAENAYGPPLVNQNQSFVAAPRRIKLAGLIVPEAGDIVYVINEPGQASYVYRAEVTEYPFLSENNAEFDAVKVKILNYIQPQVPTPGMRQRINTELKVSRRFIRYQRKDRSEEYLPIPDEKFREYLESLTEENPKGGAVRRKSHKKRNSTTRRRINRKKSKKSYNRRKY